MLFIVASVLSCRYFLLFAPFWQNPITMKNLHTKSLHHIDIIYNNSSTNVTSQHKGFDEQMNLDITSFKETRFALSCLKG